jgi:hypothetical protein
MSIDVDISVETDYVCLRCTGTYPLSEVKRLYQSAIDAALEHHKSKVLIDANGLTGKIPTMERFSSSVFLAEQIVGRAFGKIGRFAVVGQEPLIDEERFGETVAINRGVNAKAATSLDEAISWLSL